MQDFVQYIVSGVALGSIYALVALGFVVIYRASKVFNFAHGEFLAFGALLMALLHSPPIEGDLSNQLGGAVLSGFGLPWAVALTLTVVSTGVLAALVERLALRPLVGRPIFVTIIITLFIGVFLRTVMSLLWGTQPIPVPTPWAPMSGLELGGAVLKFDDLAPIIAAAVAISGFYCLLKFSRIGVAMRATAVDQEACVAMGIPVGRVFRATWFIAGAIAGLGGVFVGSSSEIGVDPNLGLIAFKAFPAVIVGGLESPVGAVVAGLALGVLEVLTSAYLNESLGSFGNNFHEVLPYLVMVVVLMVRPYGLFGTRKVERL
ncbi:MAG: branched-chain amino acid ABC transporter permease [Myxococcota bacterium]|nr:branched-chain amino acid ABC transporter permease [Myxococcota bacterium]